MICRNNHAPGIARLQIRPANKEDQEVPALWPGQFFRLLTTESWNNLEGEREIKSIFAGRWKVLDIGPDQSNILLFPRSPRFILQDALQGGCS